MGLCPLGRRHDIEAQLLVQSATLVQGATWEFEGEFGILVVLSAQMLVMIAQ